MMLRLRMPNLPIQLLLRKRRRWKRKFFPAIFERIFPVIFVIFWSISGHNVKCSEFPERECCDPVYPIPPPGPHTTHGHGHGQHGHGHMVAPAFPEYVMSTQQTQHHEKHEKTTTIEPPGVQTKTATAIMNCIQARDFCSDNSACSPILEIVPRVCGPEKVACSTPSPTKCQAALRTLQAFPYFSPTCLCREPTLDPHCNTFRDYLFDHPCSFVKEKEKDPYPVDALPTCDYAMDVCKKQPKCNALQRNFRTKCKAADGQCKMENSDLCHEAWTKLRMSPIFGCICPNADQRCERIFNEVNYNPCVANDPWLEVDSAGTISALFSLAPLRHPNQPLSSSDQNFLLLLASPHFSFSPASLFPPRKGSPRHELHQKMHQHQHRTKHLPPYNPQLPTDLVGAPPPQPPHILEGPLPAARTESHLTVDESFSTPISTDNGIIMPPSFSQPGSFSTSHSGSITVQVISAHQPGSDDFESQLENPLLAGAQVDQQKPGPPPPDHILTPHGHKIGHKNSHQHNKDDARAGSHGHRQPTTSSSTSPGSSAGGIATISSIARPIGGGGGERVKIPLHTTCFTAMQNCLRNPSCANLLQNVLHWCDPSRCRQDTCMLALQGFYRGVEIRWALEVAYCICRKSDNRHDQCLQAQQKLHPYCAQRGDVGIHPPSCHSLAEGCRAQPDCRARLEYYEQACAVDSVTRKCAGPVTECRNAMVGILGTKLRTSCACNGTDYTQLYDCLGWQRILWINPCVVESQRNYHAIRSGTSPFPPGARVTTTQGHEAPSDVDFSSEEDVVGTDLLSTTMGNPPAFLFTITPAENPPSRNSNKNHHHHATTSPNSNSGSHEARVVTTRQQQTTTTSRETSTSTEGVTVTHQDLTTLVTTALTRPTTIPTTSSTLPPRVCTIRRPNQQNQHILEGTSKRLYREDKPACSELCYCVQGEPASCVVLECLGTASCESKKGDTYKHSDPTYIAHRGKCICYAGRFICEKPPQESYTLYSGVFLFLGFSASDELVLKPHTHLTARDVVAALQNLISPHFQHQYFLPSEAVPNYLRKVNSTDCHLDLFKIEGENLIINATVGGSVEEEFGNFTLRQPNEELLKREKEQCLPALKALSNLVNEHHPIIHNHMLLSILKLAFVEVNIPISTSGSASAHHRSSISPLPLVPLLALSLLVLGEHLHSAILNSNSIRRESSRLLL